MPDLDVVPCPPPCGRPPRPWKILRGWSPCICGGHETRFCRADVGGCGTTLFDPPLTDPCRRVQQGFASAAPNAAP